MKNALDKIGHVLNVVARWSSQRKKALVAQVPVAVAVFAALQVNGIDGTEWGTIIGLELVALGVHQIANKPAGPGEEGEEA